MTYLSYLLGRACNVSKHSSYVLICFYFIFLVWFANLNLKVFGSCSNSFSSADHCICLPYHSRALVASLRIDEFCFDDLNTHITYYFTPG